MPNNIVKSVSEKCKMSMDEVENKWKDAKKEGEKQNHKEDFDYITGIFKKMVGKECLMEMGWTNEDLLDKIDHFLNK
jgi:hypothetical protein